MYTYRFAQVLTDFSGEETVLHEMQEGVSFSTIAEWLAVWDPSYMGDLFKK